VYLFYILSFIAVFVLRKREPNFTTYRVPLYPVVPLIAILGSLFVVGTTLMNEFGEAMLAIGITLIGLPVYAYIHRNSGPQGSGLSGGGGQA
jgi:APA family basic amino acid/polyamine antiporter